MTTTPDATRLPRAVAMRSIIQRIATGPELSKDLSLEEAQLGLELIFTGEASPVEAAVFLIALRMKRETNDENRGLLAAVRRTTLRATAAVDQVVDIADPYNGYNRTLPMTAFVPAVLAACDIPSVVHGVESVGPKHGITARLVLEAVGVPVDLSPEAAATRLAAGSAGWSYVDQRHFCPPLHQLIDLRTAIVKRPALTTVEVMAGPIVGRRGTHLVTGYVHKPYPPIYADLAHFAGYTSALLVRGVEGGIIPSLRQAGRCFRYEGAAAGVAVELVPSELGISQSLRAIGLPDDLPPSNPQDKVAMPVDVRAAAKRAADFGLEALRGVHGPARDAIIYGATLIVWHTGRAQSLHQAAEKVRAVIDSGAALARLGEN